MLTRTSPDTALAPGRAVAALPPLAADSGADLNRAQRRGVVAAIVGLHVLAVWGLLQVQAVREAAVQAAPILVNLLAAPTPPAPPPPAPAPAPKAAPRARLQPAPAPKLLASTASPTPEAITVPPPTETPEPEPAPPPPAAPVSHAEAVAVAAPPAPPAPKLLPDEAVQYLQAPQLAYPPLSLRRRETGLVTVRAYIGAEGGAPRTVQVERSSGHPRLDQAALAAVQGARFKPYAEKGRPVEGWALIPIRFQLEK
ncbi:MAG TPA: energy transducer TonB [Rubrivivax sp.]|nr:energy transducer TonB [Rubrivivax sp.]